MVKFLDVVFRWKSTLLSYFRSHDYDADDDDDDDDDDERVEEQNHRLLTNRKYFKKCKKFPI